MTTRMTKRDGVYDARMRSRLLMLCVWVVACGKQKDAAVEQFMNKDFAPAHALITEARAAYNDIGVQDIDQPGKRAFLEFRIEKVALPMFDKAYDELQALQPPAAAKAFVATTVELVAAEREQLRRVDAALTGAAPADTFKTARRALAALGPEIAIWIRERDQLLSAAKATLAPLPRAPIPDELPSMDAGAMVPGGP
jgi:hypothetical protein